MEQRSCRLSRSSTRCCCQPLESGVKPLAREQISITPALKVRANILRVLNFATVDACHQGPCNTVNIMRPQHLRSAISTNPPAPALGSIQNSITPLSHPLPLLILLRHIVYRKTYNHPKHVSDSNFNPTLPPLQPSEPSLLTPPLHSPL